MTTVEVPDTSVGFVECDGCGLEQAVLVLRWPDASYRVCPGCIPDRLRRMAEPLDPDDELAADPLNAKERARERGNHS